MLSLLKSFTEAKITKIKKIKEEIRHFAKSGRSFRAQSEAQRLQNKRRANAFEKLLAMRQARDDQDISDPLVVYQIAFASHKKEGASCPYPLLRAENHSPEFSGDLNEKQGGDYIYLCVGRKRLSELRPEEKWLNKIFLNTNQEDCGKLTPIKSTLQSSFFFSDKMTVCVGHDKKKGPWSNIRVLMKKYLTTGLPSDCSLEISEGKYLCFEIAENAPKSIEFSDLNMLKSEAKAAALGKPETVAEIDNDFTSTTDAKADNIIKRSIAFTKVKSSAWNLEKSVSFFSLLVSMWN